MLNQRYLFPIIFLLFICCALISTSSTSLSAKAVYQTLPPLQPLTINDNERIEELGYAIAHDQGTAIIGAPRKTHLDDPRGGAYIFTLINNNWAQQAILTADDLYYSAKFGSAVDISGDTVVVGAYNDDGKGDEARHPGAGSAHIFVRNGSTWTRQAHLLPDSEVGGWFGLAVAIDSDTVVVGAPTEHHPNDDSATGVAYVFVRSDTTWTQQARLMVEESILFGTTIALEGDTVMIGDRNRATVYIFRRSGTTWSQVGSLTGDGAGGNSLFGVTLALNGNTLVVGDHWYNAGAGDSQGVAYIFTETNGSWTQQQKLIASDGAESDWFGLAAAIQGDQIVVGAPGKQFGQNFGQGAAYLFSKSDETWSEEQTWNLADGADSDSLGGAAALYENGLLIGAPYRDDDTTDHGAVYAVNLSGLNNIRFAALPNRLLSDGPFTLTATATSGLPVTYSTTTPSICRIEGNTITPLTAGECAITASQAGNDTIPPADDQTRTFTLIEATNFILLPTIRR